MNIFGESKEGTDVTKRKNLLFEVGFERHKRFKTAASKQGKSISETLRELIDAYCDTMKVELNNFEEEEEKKGSFTVNV